MDTLLLIAEGGTDFSLTGMWAQMSIFAKAVLVGLIVMFVVALAIMIERLRAYSKAKRQSINYIMLLRTYLQERKMQEAFDNVLQTSLKYKTDMRTAAYVVAINRVAQVTRLRGMYA